MDRSRGVLTALAISALLGCTAASTPATARLVSRTYPTMGASVTITVWTADEPAALGAIDRVRAEFDRLDALLSIWKAGSDVVRLNAAAGVAPITVHEDTIAVLEAAHRVSRLTDGKFDVTFGALADVWKFDHDQDNRIPGADEIAERRRLVDYRAVVLDRAARTAFITRRGIRVHLGGIGKGYAVDRSAALLRQAGFGDFLIQAGGDLFVSGRPGQDAWRLGINDPRGAPGESFATLELSDRTLSTSGDYERFFIHDGQRYHHLLDPATGYPARGTVSVSIVARTALDADALSTGVFILGPAAGMALVERLPDVEAVIVTASNEVLISSGLQGRVRVLRAPAGSRP